MRILYTLDPLRVEFIRSTLSVIDGAHTETLATDILFAFIKGVSRIPVTGEAETRLTSFLAHTARRCAGGKVSTDESVNSIAAVVAAASAGDPAVYDQLPVSDEI